MLFTYEDDYYLIFEQEKKESLPLDGWLHNCIFCLDITGSMIDFPNENIKIRLMCCGKCKNELKNEDEVKRLNKWIYKNIPQSRRKLFCIC